MANEQMYQVTIAGEDRSPWELLAKSEEHAAMVVRKFYPEVGDKELVVQEVTILGEPVSLLHTLSHGDKFAIILKFASQRLACRSMEFTKGDFNPARNEYLCHRVDGRATEYIGPYAKVIRL